MKRTIASLMLFTTCAATAGTSFAQSKDVTPAFTWTHDLKDLQDIVRKNPPIINPKGTTANWVAIGAVAGAVYAATEVAHHYKERWIPGMLDGGLTAINPDLMADIFDVTSAQVLSINRQLVLRQKRTKAPMSLVEQMSYMRQITNFANEAAALAESE